MHTSELGSSVSITTGYGLDDRMIGIRILAGAENFSFRRCVQNGSGTHTASYPMGTGGSYLGIRRPEREADHSPLSSAEVKECMELYLHSPVLLQRIRPNPRPSVPFRNKLLIYREQLLASVQLQSWRTTPF